MPAPARDTGRVAIDVRDVLDTLWLATWLNEPSAVQAKSNDGAIGVSETAQGDSAIESPLKTLIEESKTTRPLEPASPTAPAAGGRLYAAGQHAEQGPGRSIRARPIRIPAGSALPNSLPIVRALRTIPARLPSRTHVDLDEDATVEASAQGIGVVPVLRPRHERWFDAVLVVDHLRGAEMWAQTVIEIERMLAFSGVFRDVRTFRLLLRPTLRLLNESGRAVHPGTLRDPAARRVIFVFSTGVTDAWIDGTCGRLIDEWGTTTPVALLHALPRRLWANTVLGDPAILVTNAAPGGPNSGLIRHRAWWARARRIDGRRAPLPVLSLDAESTLRWAEMVAARRGRAAPAFLVPIGRVDDRRRQATPRRAISIEERVALFRAHAPDAFRLAVHVAAGPFTMPILQLVQQSLFGRDAQHSQVAEVMLSGLVVRTTAEEADTPPEHVQFQFMPGAADLLLESFRRDDARRMASLLEQYIEQHFGTPRDQLVLLDDPRGPALLPGAARPFAQLNDSFVRWLERSATQTGTSPDR